MKLRYPFVEPPFECEHHRHADGSLTAFGARFQRGLTHYILDNGYTVSVRNNEPLIDVPTWELIVWPTDKGLGPMSQHQIGGTHYYDDPVSPLIERNRIAGWPSARPLSDAELAHLRAEFERPYR